MRADRLMAIVTLLRARGRISSAQLAAMLEVSERTILRDLDALGGTGVPVYAIRGPGGGFELDRAFHVDFSTLSEDESAALDLLALPAVAESLGFGPALRQVRLKLDTALPPSGRAALQLMSERVLITAQPSDAPEARILAVLRQAIWSNRAVRLYFVDGTNTVAEPFGLVLDDGAWNLVAGVHRSAATIPIARLRRAASTGAAFGRPEGFDLREWWSARSRGSKPPPLSPR